MLKFKIFQGKFDITSLGFLSISTSVKATNLHLDFQKKSGGETPGPPAPDPPFAPQGQRGSRCYVRMLYVVL